MALFQEKDRGRKGGFFKVIKKLAIKKKIPNFSPTLNRKNNQKISQL
jgi:hypothetical protein